MAILDAAIHCYIDIGYARTTLQQIADRTGLSRGAILYHFPSMTEITMAALNHLNTRWLNAYRDRLDRLPRDDNYVHATIDAFWEQLADPLFSAMLELIVAARTDSQLQAIVAPARRAFTEELNSLSAEHAPSDNKRDDRLDLAVDLAEYLMIGMAVGIVWTESDDRQDRVLDYLKNHIRRLFDEGPQALS
ncbi:MAG: TetR/AcrR family transcriptional regulator [Alphaproteobacteria bacterium]